MKKYWVAGLLLLLVGCGGGGGSNSSGNDVGVSTATISRFAGSLTTAGALNGPGATAEFRSPLGVALDGSGNLYVADQLNNTIRKITASGVVSTLAGQAGVTGSADGPGTSASFNAPAGVAVDGSGNVYVADSLNYTVRKITASGVVSTLAGTAGKAGFAEGSVALFSTVMGVAVNSSGSTIYVSDSGNNAIREISSAGVVSTLAGTPSSTAVINEPAGIAVDGSGNVYVANFGNSTILEISPEGVVTTLAGQTGLAGWADGTGTSVVKFNYPFGIALDASGNVFVADTGNDVLREISPLQVVTTIAGAVGKNNLTLGSSGTFSHPYAMAMGSSGVLYTTSANAVLSVVTK